MRERCAGRAAGCGNNRSRLDKLAADFAPNVTGAAVFGMVQDFLCVAPLGIGLLMLAGITAFGAHAVFSFVVFLGSNDCSAAYPFMENFHIEIFDG